MLMNKLILDDRIQPYCGTGIVCIYPTVPCPSNTQATSELEVITTTDFDGWPCQRDPVTYHKQPQLDPENCRKGYCFYTHQNLTLPLLVRESFTYSYGLSVELKPGFNMLSWCDEAVLVNSDDYETRFASPTIPSFSLLLCCMGMSLTFTPKDPTDLDSPYVTSPNFYPTPYQLAEHPYPPVLTVLSSIGTVPSLYLLAKLAGGGRGLIFERIAGFAMDNSLTKVTFHSLSNKLSPIH
jgi:hypothetical protein